MNRTLTILLGLALLAAAAAGTWWCRTQRTPTPHPAAPPTNVKPPVAETSPAPDFPALPPFKEAAVAIANADFSTPETAEGQLPGWSFEGPPRAPKPVLGEEPERGKFFIADLQPGERCVLRTAESLALMPHHHYRLEMDVRGAPFTRWSIELSMRGEDSPTAASLVWPLLAWSAVPPPPVWEHRTWFFTATEGLTRAQLQFTYESLGARYELRPGLGRIHLTDLGPVALSLKPGSNCKPNPGVEEDPFEASQVPGWTEGGEAMNDKTSAHSGEKFYRVKVKTRCILNWLAANYSHPPALIKAVVWARGKGLRLHLVLKQDAPGLGRLADQNSRPVELTEEWKRCECEFRVFPESASWGVALDLFGNGPVDLDDMEVQVIPIRLPAGSER